MQWGLFLIILMGHLSSFTCDEYEVILIKELMTWEEALNYCRQHYYDLVSITDDQQQKRVHKKAMNASSLFVWLGLRYSCALNLWFWINDKMVCYDNWASENNTHTQCDWAAAMDKKGQWFKKTERETLNFICAKHT